MRTRFSRAVVTGGAGAPCERLECYKPTDLSASFTFDGYTTTEYPAGAAPEIIAWSTIHGGRASSDVKGVLNPRRFGAIGAYDGHRVGIGRVSVDATWHHFFDVNLIGELGETDPIKALDSTPHRLATPSTRK